MLCAHMSTHSHTQAHTHSHPAVPRCTPRVSGSGGLCLTPHPGSSCFKSLGIKDFRGHCRSWDIEAWLSWAPGSLVPYPPPTPTAGLAAIERLGGKCPETAWSGPEKSCACGVCRCEAGVLAGSPCPPGPRPSLVTARWNVVLSSLVCSGPTAPSSVDMKPQTGLPEGWGTPARWQGTPSGPASPP